SATRRATTVPMPPATSPLFGLGRTNQLSFVHILEAGRQPPSNSRPCLQGLDALWAQTFPNRTPDSRPPIVNNRIDSFQTQFGASAGTNPCVQLDAGLQQVLSMTITSVIESSPFPNLLRCLWSVESPGWSSRPRRPDRNSFLRA